MHVGRQQRPDMPAAIENQGAGSPMLRGEVIGMFF
jgi:hypothetical protein